MIWNVAIWVKVPPNEKGPREKDWPNKAKTYQEIIELVKNEGCNIGLMHGPVTMAIDIDNLQKFENVFGKIGPYINNTLSIKTAKGYHLIYWHEPDLKNLKLDFGDFLYQNKISLAPPSVVDSIKRQWIGFPMPNKIPPMLLKYIQQFVKKN